MSFSVATCQKFWRLQRRVCGATMPSGTPNLQKPLPDMIRACARSPFTRKGSCFAASLIRHAALWRIDDRRRAFSLQRDIEALERKIEAIGDVALVIIDPVSSYLGKTDSHKNGEVRGVLEPLSEMAERLRVAILSVTHFSKGPTGNTMKALHRFIGSIAFTGAPRCAFAVVADAQNSRTLFLHAKNNLAARPQGLAYRLEQCIVGEPKSGIVASRITWESEPVSITADQALAAEAGSNAETRTAKAEAMEFLQSALADGPVPAIEINRMAREHGLAPKAVRSAREALGVKIERDGFGPGSKSLWSISGDT
jgi:putative DNA primase/helicase